MKTTAYLPVRLLPLFPHHDVELAIVLVTEDEASVVIVDLRVDVEGTAEVHAAESVIA